jgi:hypothetical protein
MQDMHEWYYENKTLPKLKNQLEWARLSQEAKLNKLNNKKSKRDIAREVRVAELGGTPVEVTYGVPLSDEERETRMTVEWDLKYPKRHMKKHERREPVVANKGADRTSEEFRTAILRGARARATKYGIPFDLTLQDIVIPEVCPVLGSPMCWGDSITEHTPSLDRVVPDLGYVSGNVNIISFRANRLKNNATKEEVEALLAYITGN